VRVIFASYGNDSIALIQWAHVQQRNCNYGYDDVRVVYTDTGWAADWWPARVLKGEAWARSLGFKPVRIEGPGMERLVERKKAWPRGGGGKFQFCTEALKEAPALAWLDEVDPDREAICMVGIRRSESANRATFPEWTEVSERHGGRSLHAPLVRMTAGERDSVLRFRTPFPPLPHRSKECWPCVNAGKRELKLLEPQRIEVIRRIEQRMGTNSAGNERVMFSPARHGGAVGIDAVVEDARHGHDELFAVGSCDGGWCE
jgi:3'-phosphoadenosine 5'-phosphosulfate sulfotransferase (PAPS reductase)/FAD synthetase